MASEADKFAVGYISQTGIGGWLILFIIWMWIQVANCLLAIIVARHNYLLVALSVALLGLSASAAYLLSIKDSKGVLLAKLYLVADLATLLVDFARLADGHLERVATGATLALSPARGIIFRTIVAAGVTILWYSYLLRSRRVKKVYFPASP